MKEKYRSVEALHTNPHLNFYHMDALTDSGRAFDYYFVSRNDEEHIRLRTGQDSAEGVVIYPVLREDPGRLVLIRQYRYPLGSRLYELPAGLIEEGESPAEAAIREMKEETGYRFVPVETDSIWSRPFYMGAGFTDEACVAVFGYAEGSGNEQAVEDTESIRAFTAGKEEVRRILKEERVSLRMAYLMMSFLQSDPERPFEFVGVRTS
ncbi:MAG: NUDIX hydrolase [Lachnospiraceae bacterium]|nr:NUDIX hydrolase [Lachnospiraceae bacterium]